MSIVNPFQLCLTTVLSLYIKAHTRGLPEDVAGPVRVIEMGEVDSNMCCGTHVSNLAQLQAVKLLNAEKGKKGKSLVHFLVGSRVSPSKRKKELCTHRFCTRNRLYDTWIAPSSESNK